MHIHDETCRQCIIGCPSSITRFDKAENSVLRWLRIWSLRSSSWRSDRHWIPRHGGNRAHKRHRHHWKFWNYSHADEHVTSLQDEYGTRYVRFSWWKAETFRANQDIYEVHREEEGQETLVNLVEWYLGLSDSETETTEDSRHLGEHHRDDDVTKIYLYDSTC